MTDQLDYLCEAVENKLNKRPNCAQCEDHPRLVDGCGRCKGSGLEPVTTCSGEFVRQAQDEK